MTSSFDALKKLIRDVPDFPKKGILYKDITPLLSDGPSFQLVVDHLAQVGIDHGIKKIVAIESRGFIFGAAVAHRMGVGVVPVRKKGKLPYKTHSVRYQLEYGEDVLEMHVDGVGPSDTVMIVDDVLATGGTAEAVLDLVAKAGGRTVASVFVIELGFLKGRERLKTSHVTSLVHY